MQPWQGAPFPPPVGGAAAAFGLGGLVTSAEADNRTIYRRMALQAAGLTVLLGSLGILNRLDALGPVQLFLVMALVFGGVFLVERATGRPGTTLYLFERGVVLDQRGQVQPLAWPQLAPYLQHQRMNNVGSRWVLTVKVADRAVFRCTGDEASRLAEVMSVIELARLRSVLAAGGTVDYGVLRVTREGLVFPRRTLPWAHVRWFPRGRLPHQRALVVLAEQLTATRPTAGSG
jgi:hypothetical protein